MSKKQRYTVEVVETREIRVLYTVEADDPSEAKSLAEAGETTHEQEYPDSLEVIAREPVSLFAAKQS